jgi:hypothetical protein
VNSSYVKEKMEKIEKIKEATKITSLKDKRREEKEKMRQSIGGEPSKMEVPKMTKSISSNAEGSMIDENKPIMRKTTALVTTTASVTNNKGITTNFNMDRLQTRPKSNSIHMKNKSPGRMSLQPASLQESRSKLLGNFSNH